MDGNRRWAKKRGLYAISGHQAGAEALERCVLWSRDRGLPHVVFYAFSTENWQRSEEEVSSLLALFKKLLNKQYKKIHEYKVRVKFVGERSRFGDEVVKKLCTIEEESAEYTATTIWIALSYGGRAEIVSAANKAVENGGLVDEAVFKSLLWTVDLPDPDLIVRTGGEQRLSNFLTWGAAYAELLFLEKYWPELTEADFDAMLAEYDKRERRRGR